MKRNCGRSRWRPAGAGAALAGLVLLAGAAAAARAQNAPAVRAASRFHPDASFTADSLLRTAAGHVKNGQWAEAIGLYQRVIREFGGTVTKIVPPDLPAGAGTQLFVDARENAHRQLAAMPPEARAVYRRRVDAEADRLYRDGLARRDPAPLRRVVETAFCSSRGDDAADLLGDWAFRDGRFGEALACYRRLVPDAADPNTLRHPDPDVDRARVAAKILLCRAAMGETPPGDAELKAFATQFPDAAGRLAGRNGPLAASVAQAVAADRLAPPPLPDGRWPTFAGAPTRTRVAAAPIDVGSLQWRVKLEPINPVRSVNGPFMIGGRFQPASAPRPDRGLAYFPAVVGDQVVLCDASRLMAYNLGDRPVSDAAAAAAQAEVKVAWDQPLPNAFGGPSARPVYGTPRYTVTGHGDRIFARLGPPGSRIGPSYVVAVRNNREVDGKLLWRRASNDIDLPRKPNGPALPSRSAAFEGTPVADGRNVYVGLTEPGAMIASYVACLDAETGATRWVRFLGEATAPFDQMGGFPTSDDVGTRLLSLAGGTLYYQTNLGALAAIEAETGAIRWIATYPQRDLRGGMASGGRDLNPAIVHDGLVIIAPDDAAEILAFRAGAGTLAWKSPALPEVSHLLGVAGGRLIATGNRVWSLDAATGKVLIYWPQGGAGFPGYGRGVLAGGAIYWPTRETIHVLDLATGLKADRGPIALQQAFGTGGGNLAVGDGYLVVAQEDALVVFCQNSRLIHRFKEAIAAAPGDAANYMRLARVAEATGDDELALSSLDGVLAHAKPAETLDGQPLRDAARGGRHRLLVRAGTAAMRAGRWAEAAKRFEGAAADAPGDREALAARLLWADALDRDRRPKAAVALLQDLLAQERLRGLTVPADDRRTVRADLLIADRLAVLIAAHGTELYADFERQARALLARGRAEGDARLLEEIGRSFPAARAVPEALLALGALRLHPKDARDARPADAARAYRRLLAVAADDPTRARALIGLAEAYAAQGFLVPAREAYDQAQARYPEVRLEPEGGGGGGAAPDRTVASVVAERLAAGPFARLAADRDAPGLPSPLVRLWSAKWSAPARPIAADGVPPAPAAGRVFLAEGSALRPVEPRSGKSAWSADLGDAPVWVGYLADRVLAATATRLVALDVASGEVRWRFDAADPNPVRRVANPFAGARAVEPPKAPRGGPIAGFRVEGNRVYCLRGDRELLALDGESGQVDWSYTPAAGALNSRFWVGPRRVLVQTLSPGAVVVLDTETGTRRAEFAQPEQDEPWARDPMPVDEDHVAVVVDARTVVLLNAETGHRVWTYREASALPRSGPPRLLGSGGRLLVLRDGSELVRLDPASGKKLWGRVLGVEDLSEWPDGIVVDEDRVYCATARSVAAYRLADGEPAWKRQLTGPAAGWALALADRCVAAYPSPLRSFEADGISSLPLVLCRRDTGDLVQRVLFDAPVTALAVRLAPGSIVVATQREGWALGGRPPMDDARAGR
jgi:outer membrane protein assembly factor BamB/tetratricopeptide (TPR) repeat protein